MLFFSNVDVLVNSEAALKLKWPLSFRPVKAKYISTVKLNKLRRWFHWSDT